MLHERDAARIDEARPGVVRKPGGCVTVRGISGPHDRAPCYIRYGAQYDTFGARRCPLRSDSASGHSSSPRSPPLPGTVSPSASDPMRESDSSAVGSAWSPSPDSEGPVYGVSTGFGALSTTRIAREPWGNCRSRSCLSHAAGMGPPVEREVVRAMMFLRARTLAFGFSGVRPEVVEAIVAVLNSGYHADRSGIRLAGGQRRPRAARARVARAARRGRGRSIDGDTT